MSLDPTGTAHEQLILKKNLLSVIVVLWHTWELLIITGVQLGGTRLVVTARSQLISISHYAVLPVHSFPHLDPVLKPLVMSREGAGMKEARIGW